MRGAFMAGAAHLFAAMVSVLDPGVEPTADDMRRMDMIAREINAWMPRLRAQLDNPKPTQEPA